MMDQNSLKQMVADEAVKFIKDGMVVGLGSGSTIRLMVDALGQRVKAENLKINCVSTSKYTANQARELGMLVKGIDEVETIDLTIDGADEISDDFDGIKGGGAAHLWEKIVAINSKRNMWIVDEGKLVHQLGEFPLPVEVIPFGSGQLFKKLEAKGYHPTFRMNGDQYLLTDSDNYIIDLHLKHIEDPHALASELISLVGVVEHGLFLDIADYVIVGTQTGIKRMTRDGESFDQLK